MNALMILIPLALLLGLIGLGGFIWSAKNGQYEDLEGAANRILFDDDLEEDVKDEEDAKDQKDPSSDD